MPGADIRLAPSAWVCRFAPLITPGGRVLDLAAGGGRHSRWLLQQGFHVVAADRDTAGLADLSVHDRCEVIRLDFESGGAWRLGDEYDGIVVTNYLHRPLFPSLFEALGGDGILIYETFAHGNERFGKPSNPDFLLRPGELLERCAGLTILAFEQGETVQPRPAMVQRIVAAKSGIGFRLPDDRRSPPAERIHS